jgi:GNAT superfamily N-acetyltransferase
MDSAVTIRSEDFNHPDSVALRAEMVAELHAVYGFDSEPGAKPTAADMPIFLMARNSDGGAVGCGGLRRLDETTVEIKRIFVRPGARGRGIARLILKPLEAEAAQLGATRIVLETGRDRPEAIRLYVRSGYTPIDCFGSYKGEPLSLCYERLIEEAEPSS